MNSYTEEELRWKINQLRSENEDLKNENYKLRDERDKLQYRIDKELLPRIKAEKKSYDKWVLNGRH